MEAFIYLKSVFLFLFFLSFFVLFFRHKHVQVEFGLLLSQCNQISAILWGIVYHSSPHLTSVLWNVEF